MKIAMPYQDGVLLEHFGRAKEFIIYNVSDLDPVTSEVIAPEDLSHAAVARVLKEHGVDVVLCGSIGEHARQAVEGRAYACLFRHHRRGGRCARALFAGKPGGRRRRFCRRGRLRRLRRRLRLRRVRRLLRLRRRSRSASPTSKPRTFTDIVTLTSENFQTEVLDDPGLILIDFWAEWCQPCRMLAPAFEELNREEPQVKFCRVNVDEQGELAQMFGIESIPTLAVVQDRHTLTGSVGLRSKEEIKAMLDGCK